MRTMRPSGHETPKVPWVLLSWVELSLEKCPPCHKLVSCCCPPTPCTYTLLWWLRVRCLLACYSYIHNTKANGTWQPSQHHFLRHSVSLARSLSLSLSMCLCQLCVCVIYSYADCRDNAGVCVCAAEDTQQRKRERESRRKKESALHGKRKRSAAGNRQSGC